MKKYRKDFPILSESINGKPLIYLDNAATTQKPLCVLEATSKFYQEQNANVHRGIHELSNRATSVYEGARKRACEFIGAKKTENIVFVRGTTEAINLVAFSWGEENIHEGDSILLTEMEHHSNIVPWQLLAERKKATLIFVPVTENAQALDIVAAKKIIAEKKPKLFSFTHASNTLGIINPVKELCSFARSHSVTTLIDAAQSVGHMPLNVQEMGCDLLAFSGHKMCAPTAIGVLYGKEEILEAMPPWHGGGEMISRVEFSASTYKPPPHRFEAGTPAIAETAGLHAAMDYLESIGRDRIFAHDQKLATHAASLLREVPGVKVLGEPSTRSGVVAFSIDGVHAHDIATFANEEGVAVRAGHHCNQPLMRKLGLISSARASFYLYNNEEEVSRLLEVIKKTQKILNP